MGGRKGISRAVNELGVRLRSTHWPTVSFLLSPDMIPGKASVVVIAKNRISTNAQLVSFSIPLMFGSSERVVLEETLSGKEGYPIWTWEVIYIRVAWCTAFPSQNYRFPKGSVSWAENFWPAHGCEHVDEPDHCKFPCHVISGQISWNWPRVLLKLNCWFTFTQIDKKNSNQRFISLFSMKHDKIVLGYNYKPSPTSTNHWSILEYHTGINVCQSVRWQVSGT